MGWDFFFKLSYKRVKEGWGQCILFWTVAVFITQNVATLQMGPNSPL